MDSRSLSDPLDHYDYLTLDVSCQCPVCRSWRETKAVYEVVLHQVVNHERSCVCDLCRQMRRLRTPYHAAMNKRDLYCEMSYHASRAERDFNPGHLMAWLENVVTNPKVSDGWWSSRAPYYPIAHWQQKYRRDAIIAVTGFVRPSVFLHDQTVVQVSGLVVVSGVALTNPVSGETTYIVRVSPIMSFLDIATNELNRLFEKKESLLKQIASVEQDIPDLEAAVRVASRLAIKEEKAAAPPAPAKPVRLRDDGPRPRDVVVEVLAAVPDGLTTAQVKAKTDALGHTWKQATIYAALSEVREKGLIHKSGNNWVTGPQPVAVEQAAA